MGQRAIRIPFEDVLLEKGNHATFRLMDANGGLQSIPFHRVGGEVYKDGDKIWRRTLWSGIVLKKEEIFKRKYDDH